MALTVLAELAGVRFGRLDSLLVTTWYGAATLAPLDVYERLEEQLIAEHGMLTLLTVIVNSPAAPEKGVAQRAAAISARFEKQLRASLVVVLARGLGAVLVRSFLTGFSLASKVPMHTFRDLSGAATCIAGLPGQTPRLEQDDGAAALEAFVTLPPPG
jgi:hypothetical protein